MKNKLITLGAGTIAAVGIFAGFAVGGNPPPGQDPCSHGNTGKVCRPDPQPNRGKDCLHHGKKGGVNEDHCAGTTTGTTASTTTGTAPSTSTNTVTVTVPTPGPSTTNTNTVTTTTPGKVKVVQKRVIVKVHIRIASHHRPKTTG